MCSVLSVEGGSEEEAHKADEDSDGERGGETANPRQPALVNIEPVGFVLDQVYKLSVQPLAVEVVNGVLKWILVTLLAHALVSSSLEPSPLDWHTLKVKYFILSLTKNPL